LWGYIRPYWVGSKYCDNLLVALFKGCEIVVSNMIKVFGFQCLARTQMEPVTDT
jgi:hypothetical protein